MSDLWWNQRDVKVIFFLNWHLIWSDWNFVEIVPSLCISVLIGPSWLNPEGEFFFLNTIFVSSHMYPENPEETQIIVGSVNMGYISDTARNWVHNLFRPKREPIPLGHSDRVKLPTSNKMNLASPCVFTLQPSVLSYILFYLLFSVHFLRSLKQSKRNLSRTKPRKTMSDGSRLPWFVRFNHSCSCWLLILRKYFHFMNKLSSSLLNLNLNCIL